MSLAIFDLDNTLLAGDSDYLWGRFLCREGYVDAAWYEEENQRYYQAYKAGTLDIHEFLAFSLRPLSEIEPRTLEQLHRQFLSEFIMPLVTPEARQLVEDHRARGDTLLIITATNRFITAPIAEVFEIPNLLATDPAVKEGRYTGQVAGVPCFQDGKVTRLRQWLGETGHTLEDSYFYSDSHNDLPLLRQVTHPVAVNPDPQLRREAQQKGWPVRHLPIPEAAREASR